MTIIELEGNDNNTKIDRALEETGRQMREARYI